MTICKLCKSEDVRSLSSTENISYKGLLLPVEMALSRCNGCEREFISKYQIMANDARIRDVKKKHDGLLTSGEIYSARVSLGLTQEQASIVFGGGKNAFSKYERAEVSQSLAMDKLVRVCLRHPKVFNELCANAGLGK